MKLKLFSLALAIVVISSLGLISAFVDSDCDSGTLSDTCILNHTYSVTNNEQINGTGNFVMGTNGSIFNSSGISFGINFTSGQVVLLSGANITVSGNNSASAPKPGSNITILAGSFNLTTGSSLISAGGNLTSSRVGTSAGSGGILNLTANSFSLYGQIIYSGGTSLGASNYGHGGHGGTLQINTQSDVVINSPINATGGKAYNGGGYYRGNGGVIIFNNPAFNLTINNTLYLTSGIEGYIQGSWKNSTLIAANIIIGPSADTKIYAIINATGMITILGKLTGDSPNSAFYPGAPSAGSLTLNANIINLTSTGTLSATGGNLSISTYGSAGSGGILNLTANSFSLYGQIIYSGGTFIGGSNYGSGGHGGTLQINTQSDVVINSPINATGGNGYNGAGYYRGNGGVIIFNNPAFNLTINNTLYLTSGTAGYVQGSWKTSSLIAKNIIIDSSAYTKINGTINATEMITIRGNLTGDSPNSALYPGAPSAGSLTLNANIINLTSTGTLGSKAGSLTTSCTGCYAGYGGILNLTANYFYLDGRINSMGGNTAGETNNGGAGAGGILQINTPNNLLINAIINATGGSSDTNTAGYPKGNGGVIIFNNPAVNLTINSSIDLNQGNKGYSPGNWANSIFTANNILIDTNANIKIQATINATQNLIIKGILSGDGTNSGSNSANPGGNLTIFANLINLTGNLSSNGGSLTASLAGAFAGSGGILNLTANYFYLDGRINSMGGNTIGGTNNGGAGAGGILQINTPNNLLINAIINATGGSSDINTAGYPRGNGGTFIFDNILRNLTINSTVDFNPGPISYTFAYGWKDSIINVANLEVLTNGNLYTAGTINATNSILVQGKLGPEATNTRALDNYGNTLCSGGNLTISTNFLNITSTGTISTKGASFTDNRLAAGGKGGLINISANNFTFDGAILSSGGNHAGTTNYGNGGNAGTIIFNIPNNLFFNGAINATGGTGRSNYCENGGYPGDGGNIIIDNFGYNITLNGSIINDKGPIGYCADGVWGNITLNAANLDIGSGAKLQTQGTYNITNLINITGIAGASALTGFSTGFSGGYVSYYSSAFYLGSSATISSDGSTNSVAFYPGGWGGTINITAGNIALYGTILINGGNGTGNGGTGGRLNVNGGNITSYSRIFANSGSARVGAGACASTYGHSGNGGRINFYGENIYFYNSADLKAYYPAGCGDGNGGNSSFVASKDLVINRTISALSGKTPSSTVLNGTTFLTYNNNLLLYNSSITNGPFIIKNNSFGQLEFLQKIATNYSLINYTTAISIKANNISVNIAGPVNIDLNKTAKLSIYNSSDSGYNVKSPYKNYQPCLTGCRIIQNAETYVFNVTGFSDYGVGNGTSIINLTSPAAGLYTNVTSQNMTANITVPPGISNATLYIYNTTGLFNSTAIIGFAASTFTTTVGVVVGFVEGIYNWFYSLFDVDGIQFTGSNNTLTIDLTLPVPDFANPTPRNNSGRSGTFYINFTITEINLANATLSFSNQADVICNRTSSSLSNAFSCNNANATVYNITSEIYVFLYNKSGLVAGTTYYYNLSAVDFASNKNITLNRAIRGNAAPSFVSVIQDINQNDSLDPGVKIVVTANISEQENNLDFVMFQWKNSSQGWGINNISMQNQTEIPTEDNLLLYTLYNVTFELPAYEDSLNYRIWANDTLGETSNSSQYSISNRWDCTWSMTPTDLGTIGGFYQEKTLGDIMLNNTGDIQYANNNCSLIFNGWISLNFSATYYSKITWPSGSNRGFRFYDNNSVEITSINVNASEARNITIKGIYPSSTSVFEDYSYFTIISSINDTETSLKNKTITAKMIVTPGAYLETGVEPSSQTVYLTPGTFNVAFYTKDVVSRADNINNTAYNVVLNVSLDSTLTGLKTAGDLNVSIENLTDSTKNYTNLTFTLTSANIVSLNTTSHTVRSFTSGYENSTGVLLPINHTNNQIVINNSGTVTFACYPVKDTVCVDACIDTAAGLVYDPDCSLPTTTTTTTVTVTSGGGGGGSGGGGGAVIKSEATFELLRGEEVGFSFPYKNKYPTPMSKLKFQLSGINAEYLDYSPKEVSYLAPGKEVDMNIKINAPVYFSGKKYILILDIEGFVGEETSSKFNEKKYLTLYIIEVPREEIEGYLNSTIKFIKEMNSSGWNTEKIESLYQNFMASYNDYDFGTAKKTFESIKQIYDSAVESDKIIAELNAKIKEAEKNGISIVETKKLLYTAQAAFERGDYVLALERLKQARLSFASETKGEFNLVYAVKNNPVQAFGILFGLSLVGFGSSVAVRYFLYKQKLKILKEEQELLLGLMKVVQKECFENNHMSMEEYREAMNQYEHRLSETIEEIIRIETRLLNLLKFKSKGVALIEEKKRLLKTIQNVQNDYLNKGKLETRIYENMMKTYSARLADVEEQLAFIEAQEALSRDRKVRKMFRIGKKN